MIKFINALKKFSSYLEGSNINWNIIGSFNLALQGINEKPTKIGILINFEDLDDFICIFSKFKCSQIVELENKEAMEFILYIDDIPFLICAEYSHGLFRQVDPDIITIDLDDMKLLCFSLETEKKVYGKLKKIEKVKLISEFLIGKV